MTAVRVEVAVIGGGLGGVAAALAAARSGARVLLSEETEWIGGQLTSQVVPPDEHPWIEQFGSTAAYRDLRRGIRDYYRRWYPLSERARESRHLNPGSGSVSAICHEPRVALAVLDSMLAPFVASGALTVLTRHVPVAADAHGDVIRSVQLRDTVTGGTLDVDATVFLDATETGDLLPLAGVEYVTGTESPGADRRASRGRDRGFAGHAELHRLLRDGSLGR